MPMPALLQTRPTLAAVAAAVTRADALSAARRLEIGRDLGALGALGPGDLIVSETTGRRYTAYNFVHVFAAIRDAAGIAGLRFQDLRRTCVVNLARAGCTPPEIAAVSGHKIDTVVDILETYLPRDGVMAQHAIAKLDRWRSERSRRRRSQAAGTENSSAAAAGSKRD